MSRYRPFLSLRSLFERYAERYLDGILDEDDLLAAGESKVSLLYAAILCCFAAAIGPRAEPAGQVV